MANTKISALTSASTPVAGTEVLPIVQSSATKQVSIANLTAGRSVSAADYVMSTGNLVPSTAAKGINFTANTPAAGMTSQLFNWYEEGTWTPTLIPAAGTITSQTTSGTYVKIGKLVTCQFKAAINTGTITSISSINGFPFTSNSAVATAVGVCREYNATGNLWAVLGGSSTTSFGLVSYNNSAVATNIYAWAGSITYQTT